MTCHWSYNSTHRSALSAAVPSLFLYQGPNLILSQASLGDRLQGPPGICLWHGGEPDLQTHLGNKPGVRESFFWSKSIMNSCLRPVGKERVAVGKHGKACPKQTSADDQNTSHPAAPQRERGSPYRDEGWLWATLGSGTSLTETVLPSGRWLKVAPR